LPLTAQENEVLRLSASGLGITVVADTLEQSFDAVRYNLTSAIQKLGAHSKLEAVIVALRHGLIDLPSA